MQPPTELPEPRPGSYCLHCYAPGQSTQGASTTCSACGRTQLREDGRSLWTREPRIVELEQWLRIGAVALPLFVLAWAMWPVVRGDFGARGYRTFGFLAIGLLLAMALLHDTACLVTHRRSTFRVELLWSYLPLAIGLLPVGYLLLGCLLARSLAPLAEAVAAGVLVWVGCCAAVGLGIRLLVRTLGQRRRLYVQRRIAAHLEP